MNPVRVTIIHRSLSFRSIRGWAREVRRTHPHLSLHECVMEGYAKACDEEHGYANEKWREYD